MAYHTYWESYSSYLPVLNKQQKTKLDAYFKMLLEEAALYGFIAKAEPEILWLRHILDSLLIFTHGVDLGETIVDLGSGAGLPGMVLAILLPEKNVSLLDSSRKKIRFLTRVKQALKLSNVSVTAANAEKDSLKNDTVVFRAFQKPLVAFELSLNHVKTGGKIIYWRSRPFTYEKNIETKKKIVHRMKQLGIETLDRVVFKTPEQLGVRGVYLMKRESAASAPFPRSFRDILSDPLNQMLSKLL